MTASEETGRVDFCSELEADSAGFEDDLESALALGGRPSLGLSAASAFSAIYAGLALFQL